MYINSNKLLTKSRYLIGLQCLKYLWIKCNEPDKIPELDLATKHRFEQGRLITEFAKKIFPAGINIPTDDFIENIKETKELLKRRKALFEAGVLSGNIYSRLDILLPVENDGWDIIEVKSSTKIKKEHIQEMSFQKYCCEKAGLKISKCILMYVNNKYVREGEIDPKGLLIDEDITQDVNKAMEGIGERIATMHSVIVSDQYPDIAIGKQCKNNPYDCPLKECWDFLPQDNVFDLYYGGAKSLILFQKGIQAIKDIPDDYKLSDKQMIQRECARCGELHIDKESIKVFLRNTQYPIYFMDFETFMSAIPLIDGTSPYQQIPFQFSLHVVKKENSEIEHYSFLADNDVDPRPKFLSALKSVLGEEGSIIVYYRAFEEKRLKELTKIFPEDRNWIVNALARLVDLHAPFFNFHYYNPIQKGSASIKDVLPAITEMSYEGMSINNGEDASISFMGITFKKVTEEEKAKVRANLEKYCCRDTEAMIQIINKLKELSI